MKLLFLSQYYPPETGAGATRAETLRRYLAGLGWEIDILCELPNYPDGEIPEEFRDRFFHETLEENGSSVVRTWVIPTRRENFFQQIRMFASWMFSSFLYGLMNPKKYDAVYATSPPIFGAISGLMLARLYRIPFFFEVRDLWPDAALETGQVEEKSLVYKISKYIERVLYRHADLVIPVTRRSEELIKITEPEARTHVIYNGVDVSHFRRVDKPYDIIDEPLRRDVFRVGYAGTIGVIHDLETVVRAAKMLEDEEDIEFLLIGDGSRSHQLKKMLDEHRPKNIRWIGSKSHKTIPAYLSTFDLALNPVFDTRVFESILTVKFFEYLACEVPVISTARGILKEVGEISKAAVTLPPEDPEVLARTILSLKKDEKKREQLRSNSRTFVETYFDRKKWAGELSEVLKSRLNRSTDSPTPHHSLHKDISSSGYNW
ncbi:glycosyltransferase family 4 protein [Natronogracilivirga saccharolytica]|uniref:Glycosyltransferase family 4 protein n=1 Tax=Natronogracilivirga saccharolytica TaxID=2812953 RepID=A0A8J7RLL5_9BACT|nr:glycosyltransferase family 4 protein [Natronogracilivirga saccharolytica]MBP3193915.1 glycosyltransferase family 4 protein [Natronogracilivirga saccharolytica]